MIDTFRSAAQEVGEFLCEFLNSFLGTESTHQLNVAQFQQYASIQSPHNSEVSMLCGEAKVNDELIGLLNVHP